MTLCMHQSSCNETTLETVAGRIGQNGEKDNIFVAAKKVVSQCSLQKADVS
jgi:hypothetical protein